MLILAFVPTYIRTAVNVSSQNEKVQSLLSASIMPYDFHLSIVTPSLIPNRVYRQ